MRFPLSFVFLLLCCCAFAEGSRELAPNGNIVVGGNNTTDIAALLIGHAAYNRFAIYTNPDPNSRLYIHIKDPEKECVYLGFSFGHPNFTGTNPPRVPFEYRVRDPNGNIVFGPVFVSTTGANILNWSEAVTGPRQLYGPDGYDAIHVTSADLTSQGWSGKGDYFIEFNHATGNSELLIDFWDITVADCSGSDPVEKKGRVWSYNWAIFAINDYGFPTRPFNGAFYVCAPDPDDDQSAFITKIDFNGAGFQPAAFNVAFNSFGSFNTGNVSSDRRSVENLNATQSEYSVFLNDPVDLCETAEGGSIELLGVSRCAGNAFCIKYIASKEGQIDLLLDFDGPDDLYTPGTADLMIAVMVDSAEVGVPACVMWNGLDGLGNPLPEDASVAIPVVMAFAQGIYHFPIYDAELMINGFIIESVRPAGPQPLLYYDDSNITVPSGSGEPAIQLSGCVIPCHRWTNFVNNNIPGFGNLHTINSWWFSQRIVRSEVFFMPAYLTCNVEGPERICEGTTATLNIQTAHSPEDSDAPEVIAYHWSGPVIVGATDGAEVTIGGGGIYTVDVSWLTPLGDTCFSSCEITVVEDPVSYGSIDTLILSGETIQINGESFNTGGQFVQILTAANGCDSILTITITMLQTVVYYSLDACLSVPTQGSDMVYTEFTPAYPDPLSCAGLTATHAFRENTGENKHSCTPGVNGSPAICVSSLDDCNYAAGSDKSFVFEITITPATDTAVAITGLTFYERAPLMYDWINGPSGPNNYPTLYGVRILKNDVEIFRAEDVPATADWSLESYDFSGMDEFRVTEVAKFRFEFLGYCLVGNGADVAAWDMDEIRVVAACVSPHGRPGGSIAGRVMTEFGRKVPGVEIVLSEDPDFLNAETGMTNSEGVYVFPQHLTADQYYLRAHKNTGFLDGVSTLDIILIQKHLLGLKTFESPLQYLAADASGNQSVSALDIVHLRRLLLGIYDALPGNTSWRFGKPGQTLPLSDPWGFEETLVVKQDELNRENINFLAVKIGDVNGSLSNLDAEITTRSASPLVLSATDRIVTAGEPVRIAVSSLHATEILGFQCAMATPVMQILNVEGALPNMTDAWSVNDDGVLRISWSQSTPLEIPAATAIFYVTVLPASGGYLSDMIALDKAALRPEAYRGEEISVHEIQFHIAPQVKAGVQEMVFQNVPNPFSRQTEITFSTIQDGEVVLQVFTTAGRLVWTHRADYAAGMHTVTLKSDVVPVAGVLICQMRSGDVIQTRKMIMLD